MLLKTSEEDRATKQSEVNLLMDEVERAQTRLMSLEREKVDFKTISYLPGEVFVVWYHSLIRHIV